MTRPNLTLLFEPRPFRTIFSMCGRTVRLIYVQVIIRFYFHFTFHKIDLDFEKPMWSAIRQVMPNVELMGCSFHCTQALWRKVRMIISFTSMIGLKKITKRMCSAS